jgi:stage V sporulation protein G
LYADIAHPINASAREMIQNSALNEFYAELERAKQPGYKSRYDDEYFVDFDQEPRTSDTTFLRTDEAHGQQEQVPPPHSPSARQQNESDLDR